MTVSKLGRVTMLAMVAVLICFSYAAANEVINPAEDREIFHNNSNGTTTLIVDGQWHPTVKFDSGGNQVEGRVIMRYDLTSFQGIQFSQAIAHFHVWRVKFFKTLSIDTYYYEGSGTITTDDFNQGTDLLGTFVYDIPQGSEESYDPDEWIEYDVTDLINSRTGDHVYFNLRLSGEYPAFSGNVFDDGGTEHWIYISAVESNRLERPYLEISPPFVNKMKDRKVYNGRITLDGSGAYDPDSDIISYEWNLKCRGNSKFDISASGETVTIVNLKPGFYDATLTVTNDQGISTTSSFVIFSGIGPQSDYNGDSDVDGADLASFAREFGGNY